MTLSQKQRWLIFIGLALSIIMVDIDMTAANLAINAITSHLSLNLSAGQWIINGYSMAAAVLMAFAGRCGDLYGHKRIFQTALIFFAICSLAVGLSQGYWSIVLSRICQGACIAFTFPIATVIVRQVFPDEQKGFAIGLLISIAGISQAIGPSFGGLMIYYANWRWIFLINIPLAILAYVFIHAYLPSDSKAHDGKVDFIALLMLILGLFSLMTACNQVNVFGLLSYEFIGLILTSFLTLLLFIKREITSDKPLLDLKLLINHSFAKVIGTRLSVNFVYFSWLFAISLLLQTQLRYSSLKAGAIMLLLTLVTALFAAPAGKLIDKFGSKRPINIGLLLMFMSCLMLLSFHVYPGLPFLAASLLIAGFSITLLIPATATAAMKSIPIEKAGAAMGVFFTCGFVGNSLGVAITGSLLAEFQFYRGFNVAMAVCASLVLLSLYFCRSLAKEL